jgi:hypothetical protein
MTINLDELEALAKAASPGPYKFDLLKHFVNILEFPWQNGIAIPKHTTDFMEAANPETVIALIKVARAAKRVLNSEVVKQAPFAGHSEAISDLEEAIRVVE